MFFFLLWQGLAAAYPEWGSTAVQLMDRYLRLRGASFAAATTAATPSENLVPDIDNPELAKSLRQI
jgi:hypothetical protein